MRALLLLLVATPAFAIDAKQVEDACFASIKPLIHQKNTRVLAVNTTPPKPGMRKTAWHVEFDINMKLLNDEETARCIFYPDGRPLGDDYKDYLRAQENVRQREAEETKAKAEAQQKASRLNKP